MEFVKTSIAVAIIALFLTAGSSEADTLAVQWDAPTDGVTTGYVLWYGTSPTSYSSSMDVGLAITKSVEGLSGGTAYYFVVQAYNAQHEYSAFSNELMVATVLAPPTNFVATLRDLQFVDLTWQAPAGTVSGYGIQIGTTPGASNVAALTTGPTTALTISDLPPGTYYMQAYSVNSGGASGPSNGAVVTLVALVQPPLNFVGTVSIGHIIKLSWLAPSVTAVYYQIELGSAPGQSDVGIFTKAVTKWTLRDLPNGIYYIRVRTVGATGLSAPTTEVIAQVTTSVH
jgi:fibronectin type III domain protein